MTEQLKEVVDPCLHVGTWDDEAYQALKFVDQGEKGFLLVVQHEHTAVRLPLTKAQAELLATWLRERLA